MKKILPFLILCAIIITLGFFWNKSHEGDDDVIRAKQIIEQENARLDSRIDQIKFEEQKAVLKAR